MTREQFRTYIDALLLYCAASSTFLVHLHYPKIRETLEQFIPKEDCNIKFPRANRTAVTFNLYETLDSAKSDKRFNLYLLRTCLMSVLSFIGDTLAHHRFYNRTPEFQFFRHLRNAVSHGNRFHFQKHEPKYHSQFKTLILDRSLQGNENVLFDFIKPGDVIDLIGHIRDRV